MGKNAPKVQEFEPYVCNECQHEWDKKAHAKKQCPACGSPNVEAHGPAFQMVDGERKEVKKEEAVVSRPPSSQMSQAVAQTGKETFVTREDLTPPEAQFSSLLTDMGIKLPNALTKMVFNQDPHDPQKVDDMLRRYFVPPWKRQFVVDAWCSEKGIDTIPIHLTEEERARGAGVDEEDDGLDRMIRKMERMTTLKMLKDMFSPPTPAQPYAQAQPQQQQMVPLFTEEGLAVMDSEGRPVMVPAWQYQMMEQRRREKERDHELQERAQQPSQYQLGMEFADRMLAIMKEAGAGNQQAMVEMQKLTSELGMKTLEGNFGKQVSHLQNQLDMQKALDSQAQQMGSMIDAYKKEMERLARELEDMRKDRMRSIEDTQIAMQGQLNTVITDGMKEGMAEFRETRRDVKKMAKEQMRTQQLGAQVQGQVQQQVYVPSVELTPEQLQAEFSGGYPEGEVYYGEDFTTPDGEEDMRTY